MKNKWVQQIKSKGEQMLKDEAIVKKSFRSVDDILAFKKKSEDLIAKVFPLKEDADPFKLGMKEAFEYFLNIDSN